MKLAIHGTLKWACRYGPIMLEVVNNLNDCLVWHQPPRVCHHFEIREVSEWGNVLVAFTILWTSTDLFSTTLLGSTCVMTSSSRSAPDLSTSHLLDLQLNHPHPRMRCAYFSVQVARTGSLHSPVFLFFGGLWVYVILFDIESLSNEESIFT